MKKNAKAAKNVSMFVQSKSLKWLMVNLLRLTLKNAWDVKVVLRYVNPGTFGLQKLAEVLAMVYFGGLNSVYGSIVGAVSLSLLGEALRPLEILKWIIIPLLLILVMIFRPTGLIAFKELNVKNLVKPKTKK